MVKGALSPCSMWQKEQSEAFVPWFIQHPFAWLLRFNEHQPEDLNTAKNPLCASRSLRTLQWCVIFEGKSY